MAADSQVKSGSDPVGAVDATPDRAEGLHGQLKAILAADVEGYSRLMAADEMATVAQLEAGRAVFRKHIGAQGGRVAGRRRYA